MATAGYKPSPLGYGSPRSSPFRRPESPAATSPLRPTTPTASPTKLGQANGAPRFARDSSPANTTAEGWTPRGQAADEIPSPSRAPRAAAAAAAAAAPSSGTIGHGSALSQLQTSQVRTLREGFQILDRDSDGSVGREDVADMLHQLGLPSRPADVSRFFPPSSPQTITLATFLNSIATSLAALSPGAELLSAFSAFDEDDNGQVDLAELRDALLQTAPEPGERALTAAEVDKVMGGFAGRRAFGKSSRQGGLGKRGEVFKYQDFVDSVTGANGASESGASEARED